MTKKHIKIIIIILSIFLIAHFCSESWTVVFWGMFSLAAIKNIKLREFLRLDVKIRTCMYLFILVCVVVGILQNETISSRYWDEKATLGYIHYNMFGMNMSVLISEFIALYWNDKNVRLKMYIGIFAIFAFEFWAGVGRTGLYSSVIIVAISLFLLNKRILEFVRNHCIVFSAVPVVLAIISYVFSYLYNNGNRFFYFLNYLMSTRLAFSHKFLNEYNLSLLGHQLSVNRDASAGQYSALDMGYIRVGLEYGLIILLIMVAFYFMIEKVSLKTNNIGLYLAVMYFSIALTAATSVMNIANNWTLVFTASILIKYIDFLENTSI